MSALPSTRTLLATGWTIITAPAYRTTSLGLGLAYALINAFVMGVPQYLTLPSGTVFTLLYALLSFTVPLYTTIVIALIFVTMLQSKPIAPLETYILQAQHRFWKTLWVSILTALALVGGILLLIVPGVIFSIRLLFAPLLAMIDPTVAHPMKTSWSITKGRFFAVFFRYIIISAIGFIPVFLLRSIHPLLAYVGYVIHPYTLLLTIMLTYDLRKS